MVSAKLLLLAACQAVAVAVIAYRVQDWPQVQSFFTATSGCGAPTEYVIVSRQVVTPDGVFPAAGMALHGLANAPLC